MYCIRRPHVNTSAAFGAFNIRLLQELCDIGEQSEDCYPKLACDSICQLVAFIVFAESAARHSHSSAPAAIQTCVIDDDSRFQGHHSRTLTIAKGVIKQVAETDAPYFAAHFADAKCITSASASWWTHVLVCARSCITRSYLISWKASQPLTSWLARTATASGFTRALWAHGAMVCDSWRSHVTSARA
jgi:hypothetical protein